MTLSNRRKSLLLLTVTGLFALTNPDGASAQAAAEQPAAANPAAKPAPKAAAKSAAKPAAEKFKAEKPKAAKKPKVAEKPKAAEKSKSEKTAKSKKPDKSAAKPGAKTAAPDALRPSLPAQSGHVLGAPPSAAAPAKPVAAPRGAPLAMATSSSTSSVDVAAVKRAIEHVRGRRQSEANELKKSITDPVARKVVEWAILRSDDAGADFSRYSAFINANPGWPSIVTLRRKAEAMAFQERPESRDPRLLRHHKAAHGQGPLRARPRPACARRPQRRGGRGARSLAQRLILGRS